MNRPLDVIRKVGVEEQPLVPEAKLWPKREHPTGHKCKVDRAFLLKIIEQLASDCGTELHHLHTVEHFHEDMLLAIGHGNILNFPLLPHI